MSRIRSYGSWSRAALKCITVCFRLAVGSEFKSVEEQTAWLYSGARVIFGDFSLTKTTYPKLETLKMPGRVMWPAHNNTNLQPPVFLGGFFFWNEDDSSLLAGSRAGGRFGGVRKDAVWNRWRRANVFSCSQLTGLIVFFHHFYGLVKSGPGLLSL